MALTSSLRFRSSTESPLPPAKNVEIILHPRIGAPIQSNLVEAAGCDLQVRTAKSMAVGSCFQIIQMTGFPPEERQWKGVVHWAAHRGGQSELGLALSTTAPPETLIASTGSFRRQLRFQTKIAAMMQVTGGSKVMPVTVLNYSRGGMCLQTPQPLAVGNEIEVRWTPSRHSTSSISQQVVKATIRWVTPIANMSLAGCKMESGHEYPFSEIDVVRTLKSG